MVGSRRVVFHDVATNLFDTTVAGREVHCE
jgi:hypothetical protein